MKIPGTQLNRSDYPSIPSSREIPSVPETGNGIAAASAPPPGEAPDDSLTGSLETLNHNPLSEDHPEDKAGQASGTKGAGLGARETLDPRTLAVLNELKRVDRDVRAHEAAHVAVGGKFVTGGPNYQYQTGPDGKQYAVGGEVQIDTSAVPDDPMATIEKMKVVRRAALAPGDPSAQDRSVAATATKIEAQARLDAKAVEQSRQGSVPGPKTGSHFDRRA